MIVNNFFCKFKCVKFTHLDIAASALYPPGNASPSADAIAVDCGASAEGGFPSVGNWRWKPSRIALSHLKRLKLSDLATQITAFTSDKE